ncbi:nijmegen breakage syndrome 1 protein isoform X1 [Herrania umbratica]|uniref:Nijmegen breakage syndrome 1 protein isoform X1 n=1 Tax=Herrania umbratica TaxID=108875 RepID=A0A6J1BFL2_9ROSI|nr:nijmegen breakage syndrome 1 protein isoform X1 [Herrania umbratica]
MVWALLPVDPSSGEEDKYYIFRKGTYKVGRKGCDIIVHKDKGVSRIHADIIVDDMTKSSQVRIKDLSKYGTLVNKNLSSKKKVHEFPNKETSLEDGDRLSFGTGNATYRFCYFPLVFYICCAEVSQVNHHLQDKVSSIGAHLTHAFSQECTHVLIDQQMPLKEDLLDAIVAKKPVLHSSWLEFVTEKSIRTEVPGCSSHVPTIIVDGVSVEVSDANTRENCLKGYTFLLESTYMYNFGDRLQSLLEVSGSRSFWVEDICSSSQASKCGENIHLAYVIPARSADKFDHLDKLGLSCRVSEMALIRAVLSGNLDQSILISSSVLVSSSCSTDETVVADSDEEHEAATSVNANASTSKVGSQSCVNREEISMEAPNYVSKAEVSTYHGATRLEDGQVTFRDDNGCLTARRDKAEESEYGNSDIVYSQVLIVRDVNLPSTTNFITDKRVTNYKRFRKASIQSGNSFDNLVPFSKYPYKNNEFGSEELAESVKEEKKRKKMEAIAEDLFNNEKVRIVTVFFSPGFDLMIYP